MGIMDKIKGAVTSLMYGIKATEEEVFTQKGASTEIGTGIHQNVHSQKLSTMLLAGKETQEVKELRYRVYRVAEEAKNYEYITNGLAARKEEPKLPDVENSEELEVLLVQTNGELVTSIAEDFKYINTYGKSPDYTLDIERDFMPRYKVEEFCNKIVVKKLDETHVILDMYCTKYMNQENFKSKGFINEIVKINEKGLRSDIVDFKTLSFVTNNAYGYNDLVLFRYDNLRLRDIVEYKGDYVLKFKAHVVFDAIDLTSDFFCDEMERKYANKEKRDVIPNISDANYQSYTCSECGKVIDNNLHMNRINENTVPGDESEYYDAQITLESYGRVICRECLLKLDSEGRLPEFKKQ